MDLSPDKEYRVEVKLIGLPPQSSFNDGDLLPV